MEMIIILALAAGAMFLMTSRSRKQQREAASFRSNLAPGQEVMTGSGLFGTIVAVDEEKDIITIESTPGNQTRWLRAAVAKLIDPPVAEEADDTDADDTGDEPTYGSTDSLSSGQSDTADGIAAEMVVPDDLSGLSEHGVDTPERDKWRKRQDDGKDSETK